MINMNEHNGNKEYKQCSRCVMDTSDSQIKFDSSGICDHCRNFDNNIKPNWNPSVPNNQLSKLVDQIKREGKGKAYDCIIGISGGLDSSYLLHYATKVLGLRPLAFACDTGWNLNVAVENIERMTTGLDLDLYTEIVDWEEMRDLQLSFFKSQVPYQDIPQDHVIFASLYNYASKNNIKYVLTGGNYSTECVREPSEWVYMNDLRFIKDVHSKFGSMKLEKLPLCGMFKYKLYYRIFKGMKVIKLLDMLPYNKEDAIRTLNQNYGWESYKNKHYESIFTRFLEGWWLINKFGYDKRKAYFSSLILTGQKTRDEALKELSTTPYNSEQAAKDLVYISNKLGISKKDFLEMMNLPNKTYRDYKNSFWLINLAMKVARLLGIEKRQMR